MADNYVAIRIKATDEAKPQLDELQAKLDELKNKVAIARAEVDDAEGDVVLTDLEAKLERVSKMIANPKIDMAGAARANAQLTEVDAKMEATQKESKGMGAGMQMALVGLGVGAAVAVKAAGDFQDSTTHLVTDAGESAKNLGMVQQGILDVSSATATSASSITDGMYHIESGGYHGAQGLAMLKVAAEGAKVGGANLDDVAFALSGTMNAYGMSSKNAGTQTHMAASMMNELIATVGAGDMRMQDLATSLHAVAPVAATAHLAFSQVGGAMATMTAQGMSAQQASQDLGHTVGQLENPAKTASAEMTLMGLNSKDVATQLGKRGLTGTLEMLSQAAKTHAGAAGQTYAAAMSKMLNGTVGLNTSLMLTGTHLATFQGNVATVAEGAKKGGSSVANWDKIQSTFNFKLNSAKTSLENMGITLGSTLLPAVTAILQPLSKLMASIAGNKVEAALFATVIGGVVAGALGNEAKKAVTEFRHTLKGMMDVAKGIPGAISKIGSMASSVASGISTAASAIGTAAGQVWKFASQMAEGMGKALMATGRWIVEQTVAATTAIAEWISEAAAATATFLAENLATIGIIAGIALVIVAIIYLATHWKKVWSDVKNWAEDAWHFLDNHVIHPIADAIAGVVSFIKSHWALLLGILLGPIALAAGLIIQHWRAVVNGASEMFHDVVSFFQQLPHRILSAVGDLGTLLWDAGQKVIQGLLNGITSMISGVGHTMSGVVNEIKSFLPFSPAKKGPLSGAGSPLYSGQSIGRMLAQGIASGTGGVSGAMATLAGSVRAGRPGVAGGYQAALAGGTLRVQLEIVGGDDPFIRGLRQAIRVRGGNVQLVLGQGGG